MSRIPTQLTPEAFADHVEPYLSTARRGYGCKIPLYTVFKYMLYRLYTGCQWEALPIDNDPQQPAYKEISHDAVYYHFRTWSKDGSFIRVWNHSIVTVREALDLSELNLDGTHTIAKKGGESVAYQGRKQAKTSNILTVVDKNGYVIASTTIVAGNHNDSFELTDNLACLFKAIKRQDLVIKGAYFNADSAFDTKAARKVCFNHGVIPTIPENTRNRKPAKRGRKRLFNAEIYTHRFCAERTFAWIDKFKAVLVRFERKDAYCFGFHCLAFALVNLRSVIG
ncbi:MAG: IS5 family transposase [Chloroflexota bacterium]|nr:IS5 family transposase [Chloroflexota bacterium]